MKLKENKGVSLTGFVITILVILLVVAVAGCVYLLNNPVKEKVAVQNPAPVTNLNSASKVEETKTYTCQDLKGKYEANDTLFLFEDGTYDYEEDADAASGHFGNYIINGNEIVLNQLFTHGSDIGVSAEKAQIKGTINNDGSITLTLKAKAEFKKVTSSTSGNYDTLYEAVSRFIKYLEDEQAQ